MKTFNPDKPFIKIRGMGTIHYEQDGCKFNAGRKFVCNLKESELTREAIEEKKEEVRSKARAKIAGKRKKKSEKPSLAGYRESDSPSAVKGAARENEAARQAEENA